MCAWEELCRVVRLKGAGALACAREWLGWGLLYDIGRDNKITFARHDNVTIRAYYQFLIKPNELDLLMPILPAMIHLF